MKLNYNYILFETFNIEENIQTIKIKKNNYILFEIFNTVENIQSIKIKTMYKTFNILRRNQ